MLCLWYFTFSNVFSFGEIRRISYCKNKNFEKSTQPIWMKFSEKHAIKVFYYRKNCFTLSIILYFLERFFVWWNSANFFSQKSKFWEKYLTYLNEIFKHAIKVFYTQKKLHCFVYNTLLFRTFFSFHEIRQISLCKNKNFFKSSQSI